MAVLLLLSLCVVAALAKPAARQAIIPGVRLPYFSEAGNSQAYSVRPKRTSEANVIDDCMFVRAEEGDYLLQSEGDPAAVCGAMFLAPPDRLIQLRFTRLHVPCAAGGVLAVVDGWDWNNQFLPLDEDHPKESSERYVQVCGTDSELQGLQGLAQTAAAHKKRMFESSQNAAQITYNLPTGGSFAVSVRFVRNPTPCNVLTGSDEVYTLRNYGQRRNCSVTTIFPSVVQPLQLAVGVLGKHPNMEPETGPIHKCEKRGLDDYVQILGFNDLNVAPATMFGSICGLDTIPGGSSTIFCGIVNVRLVSGGRYDNSVTLSVKRAEDEQLLNTDLFCEA